MVSGLWFIWCLRKDETEEWRQIKEQKVIAALISQARRSFGLQMRDKEQYFYAHGDQLKFCQRGNP